MCRTRALKQSPHYDYEWARQVLTETEHLYIVALFCYQNVSRYNADWDAVARAIGSATAEDARRALYKIHMKLWNNDSQARPPSPLQCDETGPSVVASVEGPPPNSINRENKSPEGPDDGVPGATSAARSEGAVTDPEGVGAQFEGAVRNPGDGVARVGRPVATAGHAPSNPEVPVANLGNPIGGHEGHRVRPTGSAVGSASQSPHNLSNATYGDNGGYEVAPTGSGGSLMNRLSNAPVTTPMNLNGYDVAAAAPGMSSAIRSVNTPGTFKPISTGANDGYHISPTGTGAWSTAQPPMPVHDPRMQYNGYNAVFTGSGLSEPQNTLAVGPHGGNNAAQHNLSHGSQYGGQYRSGAPTGIPSILSTPNQWQPQLVPSHGYGYPLNPYQQQPNPSQSQYPAQEFGTPRSPEELQ